MDDLQLPSWKPDELQLPQWTETAEPSLWDKVGHGLDTALAPLGLPKRGIDWAAGKALGLPEGQSVGQGLESFIERTGVAPEPVSMFATATGDFLNRLGQDKLGKIVTKAGARAAGAGLDIATDPLSWAGAGFAKLPRLIQAGISAAFAGQMGKASIGHVKSSLAKLQADPHDADAWANLVSAGLEAGGAAMGLHGLAGAFEAGPPPKPGETPAEPRQTVEDQFRQQPQQPFGLEDLGGLAEPPVKPEMFPVDLTKPTGEFSWEDVGAAGRRAESGATASQFTEPGGKDLGPLSAYDREPTPGRVVLESGRKVDVVNSSSIEEVTPKLLEYATTPEIREVAGLFDDAVQKFAEARGLPAEFGGLEWTGYNRAGNAMVPGLADHRPGTIMMDPWSVAMTAKQLVGTTRPQGTMSLDPKVPIGLRFFLKLRELANHEVGHFGEEALHRGEGVPFEQLSPVEQRLAGDKILQTGDLTHRAGMRQGLRDAALTKIEELASTPEGIEHMNDLARNIMAQAEGLAQATQLGMSGGRSNVMAAVNADRLTAGLQPTAETASTLPPPPSQPPAAKQPGLEGQPRWLEYLNAMKSVASSLDLSAALRHGVVFSFRHPFEAAKMFAKQAKAFARQADYDRLNADLQAEPFYRDAIVDQVNIHQAGAGSTAHDLYYGSKIIADAFQKLGIPEWNWVSRSERAFTYFLNRSRYQQYAYGRKVLADLGIDSAAARRTAAEWANLSTGGMNFPRGAEGSAKMLKAAEPLLATIFYSPRLAASRIALMYPGTYLKALQGFGGAKNPAAWKALGKLHATDMAAYFGMVGGLSYAAAKMFDGTINEDPRSSDFGKVRIGDTRVDFWGGLQPYLRAAAQLASGQRTSKWGVTRETPRTDVVGSFLRSRLAPGPGLAWTALSGTDYRGEPFWGAAGDVAKGSQPLNERAATSIAGTVGGRLAESLAPMAPRDIMDIWQSGNKPLAMALALPIVAGLGASVHDPEAGMPADLREELYRAQVEPLKKVKSISLGIDVTGKTLSQHVPYLIQQDVEQLANKPLYEQVQHVIQSEAYRGMSPKMQQLFLNELIRDLNSVKQDQTLAMLPPPLLQQAFEKEQQNVASLPQW